MQDLKEKTIFSLPIELLSGYYLSFLAIGLLFVIVRNDLSGDLKQGLFFILMALIFGSLSLFKSAASKEKVQSQNAEDSVDSILEKLDWQLAESSSLAERHEVEEAIERIKFVRLEKTVDRAVDLIVRNE